MRLLIKSELRDICKKPFNAFFVIGSLTVAVMSVLVTHQLSLLIIDRLGQTGIQSTFDYVVYLDNKNEDEYFQLRAKWREVHESPITHMVPVVEGTVVFEGRVIPVLGYDPVATLPSTDESGGLALSTNTDFLTEDVVIAMGLPNLKDGQLLGLRVIDYIESSSARLIADLPTAQTLLKRPLSIDAVWLKERLQVAGWWEALVPGLTTATKGSETTIPFLNYEAVPFSRWNPASELADAIVFNLGMLSLLTLLVAGFIVFQSNQSNLRTRETQFELLNVMGLSIREQRALAFIQSTVYGLIGCGFGLVAGVLLLSIMNSDSLSETWNDLSGIGIAKSLFLGLTTTTLVACFVNFKPTEKPRWLWIAFASLAFAGLVYGLNESSGLLGASLLSVCFCVLSVFCLVPLCSRGAVLVMRRLKTNSLLLRMNLRKAVATITDVRLAINALVIAVATAIGIGIMLESFRLEFERLLDQRLSSDLHLTNAVDFDSDSFAVRPDVQSIKSYQSFRITVNGFPVQAVFAELDADERQRYGYQGSNANGLLISEKAARALGVQIGDSATLALPNSEIHRLSITHLFKDYGDPNLRVVVDKALIPVDDQVPDRFSIDTSDKFSVRTAISTSFPNIQIADNAELRQLALTAFNRSFAVAQTMVNVAIFVAVAGMVCALLGVQAQKLKEMRVLSMLGVSRGRLIADSLVQNVVLGFFSVVVALPLAAAIAWNLCYLVNPRAYGWSFDLQLTWGPVFLPVLFGVFASVCAGLEPVRRALTEVIAQPLSNVR